MRMENEDFMEHLQVDLQQGIMELLDLKKDFNHKHLRVVEKIESQYQIKELKILWMKRILNKVLQEGKC